MSLCCTVHRYESQPAQVDDLVKSVAVSSDMSLCCTVHRYESQPVQVDDLVKSCAPADCRPEPADHGAK